MINETLSPAVIQHMLPTAVIGSTVECYAQVGSTNDLVRSRARADAPEGLIILADEQLAGRGRQGRGWAAPPGSSLLLSLLLRPSWLAPADSFLLTMLAGVALCNAAEQCGSLRAALKWPNDLLLAPPAPAGAPLRKAAGVLSELELAGDTIGWVVLGIGVNVNWSPHGTVDRRNLQTTATSLSDAIGQTVDRLVLLRALLIDLDRQYVALRAGRHTELFERWRARLATLGQAVTVQLPGGQLHGVAEDVAPTGALRVRDTQGRLHSVLAGDVGG